MRTLVVTNDFPPRAGGIQTFVHELARRQPADSVVVYTAGYEGAEKFDAEQPFPVIREQASQLLPVPRVARRAREIAIAEGCTEAWFGAASPIGLIAADLRRAGIARLVASTHGHEAGLAAVPGARAVLRRVSAQVDVVTYLGAYTLRRMRRALSDDATLVQLPPGVDTEVFHPAVDGATVRRRLGLEGRPTIVCVSRLVARKGQDMLIRSLPEIQRRVPGTALLVVGGGGDMPRLQRLAAVGGVADDVVFTGEINQSELPAHYAAGDVFAMPCRTRFGGLEVEGLGIVYLEASAVGLPVVAGSSGGAPDAVREGVTGYVVDGRSASEIEERIVELLADSDRAKAMGAAGREWVTHAWRWDVLSERLRGLLLGVAPYAA